MNNSTMGFTERQWRRFWVQVVKRCLGILTAFITECAEEWKTPT